MALHGDNTEFGDTRRAADGPPGYPGRTPRGREQDGQTRGRTPRREQEGRVGVCRRHGRVSVGRLRGPGSRPDTGVQRHERPRDPRDGAAPARDGGPVRAAGRDLRPNADELRTGVPVASFEEIMASQPTMFQNTTMANLMSSAQVIGGGFALYQSLANLGSGGSG